MHETAITRIRKVAMSDGNLIGAKEVAQMLGVSLRKFEMMIMEGNAPPNIRLGRIRKWRIQAVNDWVDSLYQASNAKLNVEK